MPSTFMELVSRLTAQEETPGTFETAFSTLELQAAQLIPLTSYISNKNTSFHKTAEGVDKLVHRFFPAAFYIVGNTGFYVFGKHLPIKCVESRRGGLHLHHDVDSLGVVFHHSFYSPNLPFYSAEPVEKLFVLVLGSPFAFVAMTALFLHFYHLCSDYIPLRGICQYLKTNIFLLFLPARIKIKSEAFKGFD